MQDLIKLLGPKCFDYMYKCVVNFVIKYCFIYIVMS